MTPGIYRLTADVAVPWGDKRVKYDYWNRPLWRTGDRFRVEVSEFSQDGTGLVIEPLVPGSASVHRLGVAERNAKILSLLTPHLERKPETLTNALEVRHVSHRYALEKLVARGLVTLEQVKEVLDGE